MAADQDRSRPDLDVLSVAHARAAANYEQVAAVSGVGLALPGGCDRLLAPLGVRTLLDRILRRTGFRRLAIAAELA